MRDEKGRFTKGHFVPYEWREKLKTRTTEKFKDPKHREWFFSIHKGKIYTEDELAVLREEYPHSPVLEIAEKLGRSPYSIREKANRLGLKKIVRSPWSLNEIEILKSLYPTAPREEIQSKLPHRTWSRIKDKARHLRIRRKYAKDFPLNDFQIGFLAAAVDGEGTVTVARGGGKPRFRLIPSIKISNTNRQFLEKIQTFTTGAIIIDRRTGVYVLVIGGRNRVGILLKQVLPHLTVKRRQAELVLKFCGLGLKRQLENYGTPYTQDELDLWQQVKTLNNKRGYGHENLLRLL